MAPPRTPVADRIALNTRADGECLIWTGSKTRDGYGVIGIGRKQFRVHRVVYQMAHGSADSGLVCHKCDRPLCINPDHLFLGTHRQNTQDMIVKGRKAKVVDADHPLTKIRHSQRNIIRARRAAGERLRPIADDFGVSIKTISAICTGARNYGTA